MLLHLQTFVRAIFDFVQELCSEGSTARYQQSMNAAAFSQYEQSRVELNSTYKRLFEKLEFRTDKQRAVEIAQTRWEAFFSAEVDAFINQMEGGSAAPMLDAGYQAYLVKARVEQLDQYFDSLPSEDVDET